LNDSVIKLPRPPSGNRRVEPLALRVTSIREKDGVEYLVLKEVEKYAKTKQCSKCKEWSRTRTIPGSSKLYKITLDEAREPGRV
ncbi:hypothetical protein Q2363_26995, partial [Escherichia coli]|nr:hypothetical protein [Escherichia coli]